MIPVFSKHILQVHLVNPYLEALGLPTEPLPQTEEMAGAVPEEDEGQGMADALFD